MDCSIVRELLLVRKAEEESQLSLEETLHIVEVYAPRGCAGHHGKPLHNFVLCHVMRQDWCLVG